MSRLTESHYPKPDDAVLAARASQNIRSTTLEVLNAGISRCFEKGPNQVFIIFNVLFEAAWRGETDINRDPWVPPDGVKNDLSRWLHTFSPTHILDAARVYTVLIILLACKGDSQSLIASTRFLAPTHGVFLTMDDIKHQPSANLPALFNAAKKAAIDGKIGKTTILPVHLVDVELVRIAKMKLPTEDYPTFEHCFVIGVAREGWRLYQAWGKPYKRRGFRLDEWIMADGNRVRSWGEGKKWMRLFERFVSKTGAWTEELNEIYRDLFIPSMKDVEKRKGLSSLDILHFRPHVRVFGSMEVAIEDIQKFSIVERADPQPQSAPKPESPTETKSPGSLSMSCEQAEEWYKSTYGPVETTASGPMASQDPSIYASLTNYSTTEAAKPVIASAEKAESKQTRGFFGPTGLPVCACCVKAMKGPSTRPATQPSAKTVAKASAKAAGKAPVKDLSSVEAKPPAYGDVDGEADGDGDADSDTTIIIDHEFYLKTRIPVEAGALDDGEGPSSVDTPRGSLSTALDNINAGIDSTLSVAKAKLDSTPDHWAFRGESGTVERDDKALTEKVSELDISSDAVDNAKASANAGTEPPRTTSSKFNAEVEPVLNLTRTKLDGIRDYGSHFGFKPYPQPDLGVDLQVNAESKGEVGSAGVDTEAPVNDEALSRGEIETPTTVTSNVDTKIEAEVEHDIDVGAGPEEIVDTERTVGVDKETTIKATSQTNSELDIESGTKASAKAKSPVKPPSKVDSDVGLNTVEDAEASIDSKTPAQIETRLPVTAPSGSSAEEASVAVNVVSDSSVIENFSKLDTNAADSAEVKPHVAVKTSAHLTPKPPSLAPSKPDFRGPARVRSKNNTSTRVIPEIKPAVRPPPKANIPARWKLTPVPEQDEDQKFASEDESDGGVSLNVHDGSESRLQELNLGVARWEASRTSHAGRARTNQGRDYLQAFNLAGAAWNAELDRFRMGIKACKW